MYFDGDLSRTTGWKIETWDSGGRCNVSSYFGVVEASRFTDLLGNVSVLTFDSLGKSQLKASVTATRLAPFPNESTSSISGWARIYSNWTLPLTGALYSGARGPIVSGKSTNFGIAVNHEFTK